MPESDYAARAPEYVYAESREEAQRLLDESYLRKFRAVPIGRSTPLWMWLVFDGWLVLLGYCIGWFAR